MGLFGDLDANDISSGLKDGNHPAMLTSVEKKFSKEKEDGTGNMPYLVITYSNIPGYDFDIQDWKSLPPMPFDEMDDDVPQYRTKKGEPLTLTERDHWKRQARFLKQALENLGVPVERMNTAEAEDLNDDLAGLEVILTTYSNGDFPGVRKAVAKGSSGTSLPTRKPKVEKQTPAKVAATTPASADEDDDENPFDD